MSFSVRQSEVRLPQGLRFNDARRSAIGDNPLACRGPRAPKSHGCFGCALLPDSCSLCGSPLPRLSFVPICDACWTEIPVQSGALCSRCGDSLEAPPAKAGISPECRACRLAPPPFVRAIAYGPYEGRMRDALHALKYHRLASCRPTFGPDAGRGDRATGRGGAGRDAGGSGSASPVEICPARLQPITPLARRRLRSSQEPSRVALTLASEHSMRLRATDSQAGLTPRQRRFNVRGAFRVSDPRAVTGRHILVIDDIFTTGATARAAAQALLNAGAESVWVATLARAQMTNARPLSFAASYSAAESFENADRQLPGALTESGPASFVNQHACTHRTNDLFDEAKRMSLGKAMIHARKQKSIARAAAMAAT